jgi:hypothetical protein
VKAIEGIAADAAYAGGYVAFHRDMAYGDVPEFETAVRTLTTLARHLQRGRA